VGQMAAKASLAGGTRVQYLIEAVDGDTARVTTAVARKDGRDLLVGYRLIERGGAWKISDVTLDGVSLMANYRAQLDRVLGTASFADLLAQMRAKVGAAEPPSREAADVAAAEPSAPAADPPGAAEPPAPAVGGADGPLPRGEIRLGRLEPAPRAPAAMAATPEAPAPIAPPRRSTKAYWLRIVTTAPDEAGRLVSRLRGGKHPVGVERRTVGGAALVAVRVGPFHDAEEAVLELLALQSKGHDPYLIAERE